MMQILDPRLGPMAKSDLQFIYPRGVAGGDNPALRGVPDSALLNKNEWYEMLYFCNNFAIQYCEQRHYPNLLFFAKKAERLVKQWTPSHLRGRNNIKEWLIHNWDFYQ